MQLTKLHGLGNDFLVAFAKEVPADAPVRAQRLCDRHRGVGADGLIFAVEPQTDAHVDMALFNSDGSPAEVSGNGLRCLGQAFARRRGASALDVLVGTVVGNRLVSVRPTESPMTVSAAAELGAAGPGPNLPRRAEELVDGVGRSGTCDVGNPHVVFEVGDPRRVDVPVVGPAVESLFEPNGINVHFVTVTGCDAIELAVWERGAGVTEACGTGAAAAAVVANRWGAVGERVRVSMPGGAADVEIDDAGIVLRGPSTYVATIEVPDG